MTHILNGSGVSCADGRYLRRLAMERRFVTLLVTERGCPRDCIAGCAVDHFYVVDSSFVDCFRYRRPPVPAFLKCVSPRRVGARSFKPFTQCRALFDSFKLARRQSTLGGRYLAAFISSERRKGGDDSRQLFVITAACSWTKPRRLNCVESS